MGTVHVVGAGLAGLSAAVRLVEAGRSVILHDSAKNAGGRCRSYHDATLGLAIDNGNHLILSGNRAALDFVRLVGGEGALTVADEARFEFADLRDGRRWTLRPNEGRVPWWVLVPGRRVPDTSVSDYLAPVAILRARADETIGAVMECSGTLYERLWHPVLLAALNTEPPIASARLTAPILRETLGAGGRSCHPIVATGGLSAAFVDPALAFLEARGAVVRFGERLRSVERDGGRATALAFSSGSVPLGSEDAVVLAVAPWSAGDLLPEVTVPDEFRGIVNAHFAIAPPPGLPLVLGLIGGTSEWLFAYPDRLSVTISAGDRLFDTSREELAETIWREVASASGLSGTLPRWQIVKEKRATFAATPEQDRRRPEAATRWSNLVLAGDWTRTGLPSTIEGAIRSGVTAAGLLQRRNGSPLRSVSKG